VKKSILKTRDRFFCMKDTATILDEKAKTLAKEYLRTEAELLLVLMDMKRKRAFAELNYAGIFDYCERALKLSRAQAFYFKTVADKSEEVPEIKSAVIQGELTLSQARRIAPVVTKENHEEWIEKAKVLPQKELEREVTAINPKAHVQEKIRPVAKELSELKVPVDRETEENLEMLREILSQKRGKAATLAEVVAWAAETTREKFDPVMKAKRSRRISSGNAGNSKVEGQTDLPKDHSVPPEHQTVQAGRQAIPASVKHPVALRDGMQCAHVSSDGRRCEQKRWLQLHHQVAVKNGGLNTIQNLQTLCQAHHQFVHSRVGVALAT
jgi:hypothetical protein